MNPFPLFSRCPRSPLRAWLGTLVAGLILLGLGAGRGWAKEPVLQSGTVEVFTGPLAARPGDSLPPDLVALWQPYDIAVNGNAGKALAEVQVERLDGDRPVPFTPPPPPQSFWDSFTINKDPLQFRERLVGLLVKTPLGTPALAGSWAGPDGDAPRAAFERALAEKSAALPEGRLLAYDPGIREKREDLVLAGQKVAVFKSVDGLRAEVARLIGADAEADLGANKDPFKEHHVYAVAWLAGRASGRPLLPSTPAVSPAFRPTPVVGPTLLRFHGSNTIGGKLLPALAVAFLQSEGCANVRAVAGVNEEESAVLGDKEGHTVQIEIQAHGSATAFTDLKAGACDIGMASRKIKPAEQQALLPAFGDLTSNAGEHVLALDGIAVIVHAANPVKSLTLRQLADVFSGTVTDWSQVGGRPGPIVIFARDDKSGTYDFFNEAVLKAQGKTLKPGVERFEDSKKLSERVGADLGGVGFIGLNYIGANKVVALSDSGVEPRKPSLLTVKTEDYILSRRLYLYTPTQSANPAVSRFIEFALGSAAQPVVSTTGLVNLDLTPVPADPTDARNQSARWKQLTTGATELPTRFRFRPNSSELDTRAYRDIGRIIGVLTQSQYRGKALTLIGFADASGTAAINEKLSQNRVDVVHQELAPEGLPIAQSVGLGAQAFVATNATPEGKERNRRVEVWIK